MMRTGLRIRGTRGNREIRGAYIRFARWLRSQYEFPIRVPVYLLPGEDFTASEDGETYVSSFFAPYDRTEEPYIRIATGEYPRVKRSRGRDDALAEYIHEFSRQIACYHHWVSTGRLAQRSRTLKVADKILDDYAKTVDHP